MWSTFAYQFVALLGSALWNAGAFALCLWKDVILVALRDWGRSRAGVGERGAVNGERDSVVFYEGVVEHVRSKPVKNAFKYEVRLCMVNLDNPPDWWERSPNKGQISLTPDSVRETCGTRGPVWLLTIPSCCGYTQNPISVYYAYGEDGTTLEHCVSEVTNTPWGERVLFSFDPTAGAGGDGGTDWKLPKSLHVSPFMDMSNTWRIRTSSPFDEGGLSVDIMVGHPSYGNYFLARLSGEVSRHRRLRSEEADLATLCKYGYMPQRVAVWIYWQAMVLLWKGAPLFMHPRLDTYRPKVKEGMDAKQSGAKYITWDWTRVHFPWNRE